jgi:peptidoglycan/xylan/chitin deacetylase (PgdA/CDA1 family)
LGYIDYATDLKASYGKRSFDPSGAINIGEMGHPHVSARPNSRRLHELHVFMEIDHLRMMRLLIIVAIIMVLASGTPQPPPWNGKKCAVVLTYDDALDVHLDQVIPALDSQNFKGTFYLIVGGSVMDRRMSEWKSAAERGHELGNHSLFHPCNGSKPGRSFVTPDTDLSKYTVTRALREIRLANTLLRSIDGKTDRTFAYPCGDLLVEGKMFYDELKADFAGARGVHGAMNQLETINYDNINSYGINGHSSQYMIDLVKEAVARQAMLVFLFHGVGGGHSLNVDAREHSKLLHYLKQHEDEIWVTPLVDALKFARSQQESKK